MLILCPFITSVAAVKETLIKPAIPAKREFHCIKQ